MDSTPPGTEGLRGVLRLDVDDRVGTTQRGWRTQRSSLSFMFGPLNGVRTALVVTVVIAALAAVILGQYLVAVVFAAGVFVHGLGWWYLHKHPIE